MNIDIAVVGKIKEKYLAEGIMEYSKRLGRYCSLRILEVEDEKTPETMSYKEMEEAKRREGERLLSKIPDQALVIALSIDGKQLSSEELSEKISDLMVRGTSHIVFVIGGSLGLSDEILARSQMKLSFSRMTFPHQMMRMILLEQIYRAFRIIKNEPYHK
ncbi:23S rRNA (pseudouridine(1915)-N(3))-methyltransferase RlmH [Gudongella oleilytica]|jgi:23S rRNA (pseudouridine1915-N3)-methyltransferase|uniref:23S rRNA (pseudouridine(1915)-N(3))-methyltransferase RlmH n=1 Tax=Gudongella oleilytica TaxID=1582259 RepID=UPI000FF879E2|nr:23S rRNA (pseudouridine(1915)-N(3))-methyltransferase RlmH [Gudongella oleilytica]MDY0257584.1 23S rRNA (pseudouridine(1915)-N(3))-methyltransferase RlmH [Gudongella oleilytica]HMM69210.1 23S rRNA (pseudouridine(1915)-N(3))-methyltransferase RlmH [Gudongella oleilytica]